MDRLIFQNLDFDLAERILASGSIKRTKPLKTTKQPRKARTYRGARRNAVRIARAAELAAKRAGVAA